MRHHCCFATAFFVKNATFNARSVMQKPPNQKGTSPKAPTASSAPEERAGKLIGSRVRNAAHMIILIAGASTVVITVLGGVFGVVYQYHIGAGVLRGYLRIKKQIDGAISQKISQLEIMKKLTHLENNQRTISYAFKSAISESYPFHIELSYPHETINSILLLGPNNDRATLLCSFVYDDYQSPQSTARPDILIGFSPVHSFKTIYPPDKKIEGDSSVKPIKIKFPPKNGDRIRPGLYRLYFRLPNESVKQSYSGSIDARCAVAMVGFGRASMLESW